MEIDEIRTEIDKIDNKIIGLLHERMDLSNKIGEAKMVLKLPVFDPARYEAVLINRKEVAEELGLEPNFVSKIFKLIHDESARIQENSRQSQKD